PERDDLRRLMRRLVANPEAARKRGLAAQRSIAKRYSRAAVASILQAELGRCREMARSAAYAARPAAGQENGLPAAGQSLTPSPLHPLTPSSAGAPPFKPKANPVALDAVPPADIRQRLGRPLRVRWEGDQSILSSLALVNRELC